MSWFISQPSSAVISDAGHKARATQAAIALQSTAAVNTWARVRSFLVGGLGVVVRHAFEPQELLRRSVPSTRLLEDEDDFVPD